MPTVVGVLSVRLFVPEAHSLKDKRQVLQSLLARIANRFNVSVAEVGLNDSRNTAEIAAACVANETAQVQRVLDSVLRTIIAEPRAVVQETDMEML